MKKLTNFKSNRLLLLLIAFALMITAVGYYLLEDRSQKIVDASLNQIDKDYNSFFDFFFSERKFVLFSAKKQILKNDKFKNQINLFYENYLDSLQIKNEIYGIFEDIYLQKNVYGLTSIDFYDKDCLHLATIGQGFSKKKFECSTRETLKLEINDFETFGRLAFPIKNSNDYIITYVVLRASLMSSFSFVEYGFSFDSKRVQSTESSLLMKQDFKKFKVFSDSVFSLFRERKTFGTTDYYLWFLADVEDIIKFNQRQSLENTFLSIILFISVITFFSIFIRISPKMYYRDLLECKKNIRFLKNLMFEMGKKDFLTGLHNREVFYSFLKKKISQKEGVVFYMHIKNLYEFKEDYTSSDYALKCLTRKALMPVLRKKDFIARIFDDEIAFVVDFITLETAQNIKERAMEQIKKKCGLDVDISYLEIDDSTTSINIILNKLKGDLSLETSNGR